MSEEFIDLLSIPTINQSTNQTPPATPTKPVRASLPSHFFKSRLSGQEIDWSWMHRSINILVGIAKGIYEDFGGGGRIVADGDLRTHEHRYMC